MPLLNRTLAEFLGTFLLVFGGCGRQLWLFWVAPFIGAVLASLLYPLLARGTETYAEADA